MVQLLDELAADHTNMSRLLDLLEEQLAVFDRGDTPDYALIAAIVEYAQAYPDRYHHPKEDAIVEVMRQNAPQAAEDLDSLAGEHEQLNELTRRFAEVTERVLQDQELPRDLLHRTAREFIDAYRRHIDWEDSTVFPAARQALSEADWQAVEARLSRAADPLFGSTEEERFKALRRELLGEG